MVNARMVRQAASQHDIEARMTDGEWRLVPRRLVGTRREEKVAYYTDCHEDAYFTIPDLASRNAQ